MNKSKKPKYITPRILNTKLIKANFMSKKTPDLINLFAADHAPDN